jgi:hypothetical protein
MQGPQWTPELTIVTSLYQRDQACVRVLGDVDRAGTECLCAQLAGLLEAGVLQVRVDLSHARDSDQQLAEALGSVWARFHARGGRLITTGTVSELFTHRQSRVPGSNTLPMYHEVAAATHAYQSETLTQP